jgi:hypothetical protein
MHLPSEGNLFIARPEPLSTLLSGIDRHNIALPNFQRPWVWEPDMVRDLIVSVAYRYPAGSLLTMPVTSTNFSLRPFEGAGENLKGRVNLMVLDGQQRLTSLYQALYRREGVFFKGRRYHFYLDIPHLMSDKDGSIDVGDPYFENALFYVVEDKAAGKRIRYANLTAVYDISTRESELLAGTLPLSSIFGDSGHLEKWKQDYLVQRSEKNMDRYLELDGQWNNLVHPWLDRIRNYPFPVVELRPDMPLGAICHIFEKVNSTGVPLDVFDLSTAILWAQNFQLNVEWEKTHKELKNSFPMLQSLSGTHFLQGLSLLDSLNRKRENQASGIAVTCRRQDLMQMTSTTVQRWWNVLTEGYKEAAKFMTDQGILSERILPYTTLIIPLSAILADLKYRKGKIHIGEAWSKIERWYWCSVFSQHYSSQVETATAQDFEQVINWIEGGEPPDVVRTFNFRSDALQEITSLRNVIYKGMLCLLVRDGARDFGGGEKLSTSLFHETIQDHHHIFPTAALKRKGINDPRGDTLVNKTLISAVVNRSIGGNLPSTYVSEWRRKLGDDNFNEILTTHGIDAAVLSSDKWEDFVISRREKLRNLIQTVCGGNVQPFSDDIEVELEE